MSYAAFILPKYHHKNTARAPFFSIFTRIYHLKAYEYVIRGKTLLGGMHMSIVNIITLKGALLLSQSAK